MSFITMKIDLYKFDLRILKKNTKENESLWIVLLLILILIFLLIVLKLPQTSETINIIFVGLLLAITMFNTIYIAQSLKETEIDRKILYSQRKLEKFYYPLLYALKLEDVRKKQQIVKSIYPYQYLASSDIMEKFKDFSKRYCNIYYENSVNEKLESEMIEKLEEEITLISKEMNSHIRLKNKIKSLS
jgi:hypothetical protein